MKALEKLREFIDETLVAVDGITGFYEGIYDISSEELNELELLVSKAQREIYLKEVLNK